MVNLFFSERGSGQSIILLHGFPFNHSVWDSFAEKLSKNFHVITPDLPGFGKSPILKSPFTIDQVGDEIISWIEKKKINDSVLIGHSLGGYVALSIAEKKPALISELALFHSTAFPDSEEKKQSRNKVLEFIDKNGVEAFTSNFIAPLYYDQKHSSISKVKEIAIQASAEAVKGYTLAMRDRKDMTRVLRSFPKAVLFLAGEYDAGISVESIQKQATFCPLSETHILTQVGHMGMFESEGTTLKIITDFVHKNTLTK